MTTLGRCVSLISSNPCTPPPRLWLGRAPRSTRSLVCIRSSNPPMYRGYSNLRTCTAPRVVICSQAWASCRTLGRCVSFISSDPCEETFILKFLRICAREGLRPLPGRAQGAAYGSIHLGTEGRCLFAQSLHPSAMWGVCGDYRGTSLTKTKLPQSLP